MGTKIIPVSDLRRNVSQTIKALQQQDEAIYITQYGRPQAVLVSYEHYERLQEQARRRLRPADVEAIRTDPELVALAERIQAAPPNPAAIRPAAGSLAEALRNAPEDPDFDLETWTRQWEAVEAGMKAMERADDIAEGRG